MARNFETAQDISLELVLSTTVSENIAKGVNASVNENIISIEALNDLERDKYIFTLIFLVIVMILGMLGNVLVIFIYKTKFKRSSARVYIISLAIADFSVCVVGIPYHVLDLTFLLNYTFTPVCRLLSFFMGACTLSSIFILLVVGLDRFLKVCRPLGKQIIDFGDRKACLIVAVAAWLLNIPNGVIYGKSSFTVQGYNVTGVACFIDDDYLGSVLATGFLGFNLLLFITSAVYLIIVYVFIGRKIYQQSKLSDGMRERESSICCWCINRSKEHGDADDEVVVKFDNIEEEEVVVKFDQIEESDENKPNIELELMTEKERENNGRSLDDSPKSNLRTAKNVQTKAKETNNKTKKTDSNKKANGNSLHKVASDRIIRHTTKAAKENQTRKITLIMMTITIVFVVTYLPFICLSILYGMGEDFWESLADHESIIYDILLRLYLLNNVANPLIYSFWDKKFRRETILLFRKLTCGVLKLSEESNSSSGTVPPTIRFTTRNAS